MVNLIQPDFSRRKFLFTVGMASGSFVLPILLNGCGSGESGAAQSGSTNTSANALRLDAGAYGTLERPKNNPYMVRLVTPSGTILASYGEGDHQRLNAPKDATRVNDGSFWLVDTGNRRLVHLDDKLSLIGTIDSVAGTRFLRPASICELPDRRLVVADAGIGRLCFVNPDQSGSWFGIPVESKVKPGWKLNWASESNAGLLDCPKVVANLSDGQLLVLDTAAKRISLFDGRGNAIQSFYLGGTPSGMTVSSDDIIYIADAGSKKVSYFKLHNVLNSVSLVLDANVTPYSLEWRRGASATSVDQLFINSLT